MNSKNLKSLNESIAKVVSPVDEKNVARGFINSLTGKARQIHEEEKKEKRRRKLLPMKRQRVLIMRHPRS